jgi:3-deoxy-7-phosphoheptulonate synthase
MSQERWRDRPAAHSIHYQDGPALSQALSRLRSLPPLVSPGEVEELRRHLVDAAEGRAFVLQGGDCVERFADSSAPRIADRLKILLQMSVVLTYAARTPVVRIGRMAGQFFKPRSSETEFAGGRTVMTYRGDPVHSIDDRHPRPERLVEGYFHAASTLNYVRAMIAGGFADLHYPHAWDLNSIRESDRWGEYRQMLDRILDAIHFMESFGGVDERSIGHVQFYTSHEALHLPYEDALTRSDHTVSGHDRWYNLSAHTVWLGARTADPDGAHVAYLRDIANPIGIKVSRDHRPQDLLRLLAILDPRREPGRITLVTRLGHDHVETTLPPLISAVRAEGYPVIWSVDPMHGNTETTAGGRKTRRFEAILGELEQSFAVHRAAGSRVQGVHFELTGDDVTECTGGGVPLGEQDLERNYQSWCDPRLNYTQSMEIAFRLARLIGD